MKIKTVIFNHNQRHTAETLFSQLKDHVDVSLFDSGSRSEEIAVTTTHKLPNLYWTGCWNKAWEEFPDSTVIWGIGGDCTLLDRAEDYIAAIKSAYPFGLWSPVITGRAHGFMQSEPAGKQVFSVRQMEGIAFAVSRSLWEHCGPLDADNYIGYGQDTFCAFISRELNLKNILDGRVGLSHPASNSYDDELAKRLMNESLTQRLGADWCDKVDSWWGRPTSFKTNAISRVVFDKDGTKTYVRPFLVK